MLEKEIIQMAMKETVLDLLREVGEIKCPDCHFRRVRVTFFKGCKRCGGHESGRLIPGLLKICHNALEDKGKGCLENPDCILGCKGTGLVVEQDLGEVLKAMKETGLRYHLKSVTRGVCAKVWRKGRLEPTDWSIDSIWEYGDLEAIAWALRFETEDEAEAF